MGAEALLVAGSLVEGTAVVEAAGTIESPTFLVESRPALSWGWLFFPASVVVSDFMRKMTLPFS